MKTLAISILVLISLLPTAIAFDVDSLGLDTLVAAAKDHQVGAPQVIRGEQSVQAAISTREGPKSWSRDWSNADSSLPNIPPTTQHAPTLPTTGSANEINTWWDGCGWSSLLWNDNSCSTEHHSETSSSSSHSYSTSSSYSSDDDWMDGSDWNAYRAMAPDIFV